MKVLVVGMGSIGQRHAANLLTMPDVQVAACRSTSRPLRNHLLESEVHIYRDLSWALADGFDAVIVANPTSLHAEVALKAARAGCHLFIEKPLSHSMELVKELEETVIRNGLVAMVGCQFRFHPELHKVKEMVDGGRLGRVVGVRVEWGEYLPGWHPWEDYRQGYSARADLGGGVILTLIHVFDYLYWIFGNVKRLCAMADHLSDLELSVEDTANILIEFDQGCLGEIHLDYIQSPPTHSLQVVGQSGRLVWDYYENRIVLLEKDSAGWLELPGREGFERNEIFVSEIGHFLECVKTGRIPRVSLDDGIKTLQLALAAKRSASTGQFVEMDGWSHGN